MRLEYWSSVLSTAALARWSRCITCDGSPTFKTLHPLSFFALLCFWLIHFHTFCHFCSNSFLGIFFSFSLSLLAFFPPLLFFIFCFIGSNYAIVICCKVLIMGFSISYEGNVSSKYCLILFYFLFYWVVLFSSLCCFVRLLASGCQDCWGCDGVTSVLPTGPTGRVALSSSSTSWVPPGRSDDWVRALQSKSQNTISMHQLLLYRHH